MIGVLASALLLILLAVGCKTVWANSAVMGASSELYVVGAGAAQYEYAAAAPAQYAVASPQPLAGEVKDYGVINDGGGGGGGGGSNPPPGERVAMSAWGGEFINNAQLGHRRVAYLNSARDAYI